MATPRWQHSDEGAARIASYIAPMVTSLSWFGENIDETSITLQHQDLVEFLGTEHDNLSFSHNDLVDVMRRVLNQTRENFHPCLIRRKTIGATLTARAFELFVCTWSNVRN